MTSRMTSILSLLPLAIAACTAGPVTSAPASNASPPGSPATVSPSPSATPSPEVAAACTPATVPFAANDFTLTGAWAGDDGGIYYLRQLDSVLWWNGMSSRGGRPSGLGRDWNNVARGEIADDLTIAVDWADVPRGTILGEGTLVLKIGPDADGGIQITKTSETGTGFGNSIWTPCEPT